MRHAIGHLRWYDWAAVAAGLLTILWIELRAPRVQLALHGPQTLLVVHDRARLTSAARASFDADFAPGRYFGAFFVGRDGAFGWASGHNSAAAAQLNARARCDHNGTACRLVAELVPFEKTAPGAVTLAPSVAEEFALYRKLPGAGAFAISGNGAWGKAWGHATIWTARARALAECRANRTSNQPDYLPDWRCRIVHSHW